MHESKGDKIEAERRRSDRRKGQLAIFADRRLAARRRTARRFVDRVRAWFGLPPLS